MSITARTKQMAIQLERLFKLALRPEFCWVSIVEKITTHVLDTALGKPAVGIEVCLFQGDRLISRSVTNVDGRCSEPLAENPPPGLYRLEFAVGDYFRNQGMESPFLDCVPIQFIVAAGQSYHVPLVCTPWSYSTYRGS